MTYLALAGGLQEANEKLEVHGVPFTVARHAGRIAPIPYQTRVTVEAHVAGLFFLGMVTQARSGECGWSGERFYAYQRKLYLGDVIGRIDLLYAGNVMDGIPLIFGVNVWNYETFTAVRPHEAPSFPVFAPYREPLDSDAAARALFQNALLLRENEAGEKYSRYVLAFRTRQRRLEWVTVHPWGAREAGVGIAAVTALLEPGPVEQVLDREAEGEQVPEQSPDSARERTAELVPGGGHWRFTDQAYYVQKRYYPALDRLARRLYQFLDELPESYPAAPPDGYRGPQIALRGRPEAELLTNVYYHNIHDMVAHKVLDDGSLHTSTRDAPCYGFYEGIGTYRQGGHYNYYEQIWSRDLGRLLCELIEHGETERCVKAVDRLFRYLYDPTPIYSRPHWKRIVNASELGIFPEDYEGMSFQEFVKGRENDGHASIMLLIYRLYGHGCVDAAYLRSHRQELVDAAEWFCWQMDTPAESAFDGVLCSESESSYGQHGGYELFSNAYALAALAAFVRLANALGEDDLARRWRAYAQRLALGIERAFTTMHPRYGKVLCEPESDNWPSELKRLASLLLLPETDGYDPGQDAPQSLALWLNTYGAQKEVFWSPMVGGSMGYGQGYTTQVALLLDQVEDYTECLKWAARFSYHHSEYPYIVPEGVTYHPSGRFWYRHTDLGNAVQQTEIVKCVRLVLGLDDLRPERGLRLVPRLADGWQSLAVRAYPVAVWASGTTERVPVDWAYSREGDAYVAKLEARRPVRVASLRFGPFPPDTTAVVIEGSEATPVLRRCGTRMWAYCTLDQDLDHLRVRVAVAWPAGRS